MDISPLKIASRMPQYIRYTLTAMTYIMGLTNMIGTLNPSVGWDILFHFWPVDIQYHLALATIIVSYFLLIAPYGLVCGKRQSWRITHLPKVGLALYEVHQPDTSWLKTPRSSFEDSRAKHQKNQAETKEKVQIPEVVVHPGTGSLAL